MKPEHTPGPWKHVIPTGYDGENDGVLKSEIWVESGFVFSIIQRRQAESEANSRLIAAAPELLNALAIAEATIQRLNRHNSANGTLDVIRSAIAKATGGTI